MLLTAIGYCSLQMGRAAWPYSKNSVEFIDNDFRGYIDFLFLLMYSLGMMISGQLGDNLNVRYLYTFGLVMASASYAAIGLQGIFEVDNRWVLLGLFIVNGAA